MAKRAALLLSCSKAESDRIHREALTDRRTVSGYVLKIVMDRINSEEHILQRLGVGGARLSSWARPAKVEGPRVALMVRCSVEESQRVRAAAKRREITISGYVLTVIHAAWEVQALRSRRKERPDES